MKSRHIPFQLLAIVPVLFVSSFDLTSKAEAKSKRVLVVSAHAADFCSRAGGTIRRFVRAGHQVKVINLTYGERGESGSLWKDNPQISVQQVKMIRRKEAENAARILGAEIDFMDFDDNPIVVDESRFALLVRKIREFQPDIVLTHWRNDPINPDHATTSDVTVKACHYATLPGYEPGRTLQRFPLVLFFEPSFTTGPFTEFVPRIYVNIGEVFDKKMEALRELKTQGDLPENYTLMAKYRGAQARVNAGMTNCQYAEAFAILGALDGEGLF